MNAVRNLSLYLLVGIVFLSGCSSMQRSDRAVLPATSYTTAQAIAQPGLPNFWKVSDTLYRGGLPEREGLEYLGRMGVKTVVDLCMFHTDDVEGTGMKYVGIPMAPWDPKESQLREFLDVVTDPANQPVFVHCKHGSDRTGTFVGAYRMIVQGWSRERAIQEMTEGPFEFHRMWSGLPKFLEKLDLEQFRKEYGTPTKQAQLVR